jgi:5,10-methylene-tetrahydrofolate dehydrogenase/methenyl tetrahydrofolate cyclohydrolase
MIPNFWDDPRIQNYRKTSAITPVPGGVGPMTIAMLMYNCVSSVLENAN